jgi:hypothetical protein
MGRKILKAVILFVVTVCFVLSVPVYAQKKLLSVTHPPNNHRTTSDKIFFLGTAPKEGQVTIDGQPIDRAANGNFAPTLPLKAGENNFQIRYKDEEIQLSCWHQNRRRWPSQNSRQFDFADQPLCWGFNHRPDLRCQPS